MNNPVPPLPLEVQYPNGGVLGVQMYVYDTGSASPVLWDGGIVFTGGVTVGAITGTRSNNTAAPGTTNFGVLGAVCLTTDAGYTVGNLTALVVDTTGALKVAVTFPTSVTVSGAVTVSGTVSVSNTGFNVLNPVNVTVSNAVNVTVSNTARTLTGIAYSNGSVSSTTQRVVPAYSVPYTNAALTSSTATVSTVGVVLAGYMVYNPNASAAFVQLFDANAVAATATNPSYVISIPAQSAANRPVALGFVTALVIKAATSFAGTVAPSTALNVSFEYSVI